MGKNEVSEKVKAQISEGVFGKPGEMFMHIREFALRYGMRTSTANRLFKELRDAGLIMLCKKNHYLSHGVIMPDTPLYAIRNKRNIISLLSTHMESYYLTSFADEMEKEVRKAGYQMMMQYVSHDTYEDVLKTAYEIGVQGFAVLTEPVLAERICRKSLLPCVMGGFDLTASGIDSVLSGGEKQAEKLAEMMVDAGCDRFLFALPSEGYTETSTVYRSFRRSLEKQGFPKEEYVILTTEDLMQKKRYCTRAFTMPSKKTGIICASEGLCNLTTAYCSENNISIPEKAIIAAFRTKSAFNREYHNVITVSENVEKEAAITVDLILKRIAGDTAPPQKIIIEPIAMQR